MPTSDHDHATFPRQPRGEFVTLLKPGEWRTVYYSVYDKDTGVFSVEWQTGLIFTVAGETFKIHTAKNEQGKRMGFKIPYDIVLAVF